MKKIISLLLAATCIFCLLCMPGEAAEATSAVMKVSGFKDRKVISVNYGLSQETDKEGQLRGLPQAKTIVIRVKAADNYTDELLAWMLDPVMTKDVEIVFRNGTDNSEVKTISLKDAYCVRYTENWKEGSGYYEEIELSAKELGNGSSKYVNDWT